MRDEANRLGGFVVGAAVRARHAEGMGRERKPLAACQSTCAVQLSFLDGSFLGRWDYFTVMVIFSLITGGLWGMWL